MQTQGRGWRKASLRLALFSILTGSLGCAGPSPYAEPRFPFRTSYEGRAGAPVLLANTDWWKQLKDPTFDAVVNQALSGSLSLALARERVIEAEATARTVPEEVSLNGTLRAGRAGGASGDETITEANIGLSWLLDPFGGRRSEEEAALGRVQVAEAEVSAARLLLLRELGSAYVDLRFYQRLLALRGEDIARRRKTLVLTQQLADARDATRIDILRSEAQVAEIEAQIPALHAAVRKQKDRIAVLSGVQPGELGIDLDARPVQPRPRLSPDVGIPADLLRNRPDIRIAERRYYAAVADVGAARADLYPKLSISGAIVLAGIGAGGGAEYFFGPNVGLPALPGAPDQARFEARSSVARQAQITWKSTVLDAILEVQSALADYAASTTAVHASERTVRLRRETLDLTGDLLASDGATISDLIDAETDIADAEAMLAENLRAIGDSFVLLNVTLGSGSSMPALSTP